MKFWSRKRFQAWYRTRWAPTIFFVFLVTVRYVLCLFKIPIQSSSQFRMLLTCSAWTSEQRSKPLLVVLDKGLYYHLIWGFLQVNIKIPFNQLGSSIHGMSPDIVEDCSSIIDNWSFVGEVLNDPGKGYETLASESTCKLAERILLSTICLRKSPKSWKNERKKVENGGMSWWNSL